MASKIDVSYHFLLVSYIERKKELYSLINTLKDMIQTIDKDMISANTEGGLDSVIGFNASVTSSILEVHETLIKNDENFTKILEILKKYDIEKEDMMTNIDDSVDAVLIQSENINYNDIMKTLEKYN